jgi:hypothetical protein
VAIILVGIRKNFSGLSTDTFPVGVNAGSTYWAYDTSEEYICYDGNNWTKANQFATPNLSTEDGSNIITEDGNNIIEGRNNGDNNSISADFGAGDNF